MWRPLGLSLGLSLATGLATGVARADMPPRPPTAMMDCPPGSEPGVMGCAPLGCTSSVDCERGPCQELGLCISSRAGLPIALGRCGPDDFCPFGECEWATRCVGVELDGTASPPPLPEGLEERLLQGGEAPPPLADPNAVPEPLPAAPNPRIVERASAERADPSIDGGCGCRAAPGATRLPMWLLAAVAVTLARRSTR